MQNVIIDTDIAIDYLRGTTYAKDLIVPLWGNNTGYLSVLSAYELCGGLREKEKEHTQHFINACNIEPVTLEIAMKGGELYKQHRKNGITLTAIDCLIAATAIIKDYKIATRNVDHYPDRELVLEFDDTPQKK